MTSFESILDTPAENVEAPKTLPAGSYHAIIQGLYENVTSSKKQTPGVKFTFGGLQPMGDVDEEELDAWTKNAEGVASRNIAEATIKGTWWVTAESLFMLKDFLANAGIDENGKTIRAMLEETPNAAIGITVSHRASEDGTRIFAEVKSTFAID